MKAERTRPLNTKEAGATGPVVYFMDRDMRVRDNWALVYAQKEARTRGVPVIIVYGFIPGFLGGGYRQHAFKISALQEIEADCAAHNIPFFVIASAHPEKELVALAEKYGASEIVTDFSPLRIQRAMKDYIAKHASVRVTEVDAHNIVPAWVVSQKAEVGARTLRPKIHKVLTEYLDTFPRVAQNLEHAIRSPKIHWKTLLDDPSVDHSVTETVFVAGETAAHKALRHFIQTRLAEYADGRNDPNADAQSNLSPYLHYGMISAQRIVLDTQTHVSLEEDAFIEELVVRRELADNFCLYHPDTYDSVECFAGWAMKSLNEHRGDAREYIYTRAQFEHAKTHDDLWNACQREMVRTGKMHGYMRMYWAKKILEWTAGSEDAMKIAIYLNDKYELDGRDPNGYAGIAWSIGGIHDRAWFRRPIFGLIRYMSRNGCVSKFDVDAYIAKNTESVQG